MPNISHQQLRETSIQALIKGGATSEDADVVGNHLVESNLAGHDSHGVIRVAQYVAEMQKGVIVSGTKCSTIAETAGSASLDAKNAFGQVAADMAMRIAMDKAREAGGVSIVTASRVNHTGRLGHFVSLAAEQQMIGAMFVNGGGNGQWVAPFGGLGKRLGTNPLAIGAPRRDSFPLILDISTSVVPEGKIRHYKESGQSIPEGWLRDGEGNVTTNPADLYASLGAAVLPMGGVAAHKGFGLSCMVDVLAGGLSGAGCVRPDVDPNSPPDHGVTMLAIDVAQLTSLDTFLDQVSTLAEHVKNTPPAPGFKEVFAPGEFEHRNRIDREANGIELPDATWEILKSLV
ncbi:MAG: Ldh family oxidoreductase [Pirellulaceae bacterium]|nr:Ldh family oxidoreductase [Pirellulaceae bacterium]